MKKNASLRRFFGALFLFVAVVVAAGCGSAPVQRPPESRQRIIDANESGNAAFRKGNYEAARQFYREALRESLSIEERAGIAANALSLAVAERRLGEQAAAHETLDILLSSSVEFLPPEKGEAFYLKALLHADQKMPDAAVETIEKALASCGGACRVEGAIHNLFARLAIDRGDSVEGAREAHIGRELSRKMGDREEEANALRLAGESALLAGQTEKGRRLFEESLAIDRELALSAKMAYDILGIGESYVQEARCADAVSYLKRALVVNENGVNDETVRRKGESMLEGCRRADSSK